MQRCVLVNLVDLEYFFEKEYVVARIGLVIDEKELSNISLKMPNFTVSIRLSNFST